MESSCEQILKWTEKVLNGGELTEEEARALIRTRDEDPIFSAIIGSILSMVS